MFQIDELIFSNLIKSLTFRRAKNLILNSLSFFLSVVFKKNMMWGKPSILTIEPTNVCNLKCPLCATGSGNMKRSRGKMSLSTFKNILEKLGDDIFFLLLYHQGEPYLNKDFLAFVKLAKEKNIYCTTSSNAHYFDEKNIRATIRSGLDSMIISFDGTSQDVYEKYRVGGHLESVISGLKQFVQIKKEMKSKTPLLAVQFLVMKHNQHQINEMKDIYHEIGADRLLIKNIEVHNEAEAEEWLPNDDKYRRYHYDGKKLEVKGNDKKSCPRPWLSALVNQDGSVVPCCFDKNGSYDMGNINTAETFDEIWRGGSFTKFRNRLNSNRKSIDICKNCNQGMGDFIPDVKIWKKQKS
jgi:radical SAM protein with 4Fe4S-binding SPASM domain